MPMSNESTVESIDVMLKWIGPLALHNALRELQQVQGNSSFKISISKMLAELESIVDLNTGDRK